MNEMSLQEFQAKGYLQELNRKFLHPLGLAMAVQQNSDGTVEFGAIQDHRDSEEGVYFDIENSDDDRKEIFKVRENYINSQMATRLGRRVGALGFVNEPINYVIPENEEDHGSCDCCNDGC